MTHAEFLAKRREIKRRYFLRNPDKVRAGRRNWYHKNRKKALAGTKKSYLKHRRKRLAYARKYRKANAEKLRIKAKKYVGRYDAGIARWRRKNIKRIRASWKKRAKRYAKELREYSRKYRLRNILKLRRAKKMYYRKWKGSAKYKRYMRKTRDRNLAHVHHRRAKMLGAIIGDPARIKSYYRLMRVRKSVKCHWCRRPIPKGRRTVDHLIPLCRGGSHCVSNFVPSCKPCNCSKHKKTPSEFRAYLRLLKKSKNVA